MKPRTITVADDDCALVVREHSVEAYMGQMVDDDTMTPKQIIIGFMANVLANADLTEKYAAMFVAEIKGLTKQ